MLTLKKFRIILILIYSIPATIQAFIQPSLEKYFISNADIITLSSCKSMGELLIIVVSALFCSTKLGSLFDKLFYLCLLASCLIQVSIAAVGPEEITYRFYADTLNDSLVLAISCRVLNMMYTQLMSGNVLFKFGQAITVSIGGSRFVGYTLATFLPHISIEVSLWICAVIECVCGVIEVYLYKQAHKMIAAGLKEGDE